MYGIVGRFPFKAQKVAEVDPAKQVEGQVRIPITAQITVTGRRNRREYIVEIGRPTVCYTDGQIKKWRFP